MKNQIKISKELPMPVKSVTEKMAWLGTTGGGKTYAASSFAEQCWHIGAQFVVLDPVGVWYGLRLAKDGKKPSKINIPIFGGLHGDVPLESTGGELLANLVVDKGLSCIIDVSQFESDTEKAKFAKDFANRLFFRKKSAPSAIHLFLEECQEFVPQNPYKGEEQMLHAFIRMQKLGRNFGIGSSYITQRPQEVNKKALNMAQTLFVFRTTGTHERQAIEKWMEDKSLDQDIASDLPKLATGTCHVWSPEFLKKSEIIKISEKETFNASATPEVGAKAKARHLAPIDLDKVRKEMAATIEKAKAVDPKELRKKIMELEKELLSKPKTSEPTMMGVSQWLNYGKERKFDVYFIEKEAQKILGIREQYFKKFHTDMLKAISPAKKNIDDILNLLTEQLKQKVHPLYKSEYATPKTVLDAGFSRTYTLTPKEKKDRDMTLKRFQVAEKAKENFGEEKPLTKGAKMVLTYLHQVYPADKSKNQIWVATGYAPGSGFNNYIYELTGKEYIVKTTKGFKASYESYSPELLVEDFEITLDTWKKKLALGSKKIFELLLKDPDTAIGKAELAEETGYTPGSGFNNYIYQLTGAGLIKKADGGYIINNEILEL